MSREYMAFKAGRAFRRPGTNFVDPSPTKGAIWLKREDDDLVHFIWKSRESDAHEEDLILFPGDAQFLRVQQGEGGRVYVLKFSSSSDRHFFWLQSASSERDSEFIVNLNRVLRDPDMVPVWAAPGTSGGASGSTQAPAASSSSGQPPQATPEQLEQLRSLVASMTTPGAAAAPDLSLTDVLTPANLTPLFTEHPELVSALYPHLPPDLPRPPSAEVVRNIISGQPFRAALANFDRALRTGLLGDLVRGLGLPEEAGTGVAPFLRAVAEQARREQGEDQMDQD